MKPIYVQSSNPTEEVEEFITKFKFDRSLVRLLRRFSGNLISALTAKTSYYAYIDTDSDWTGTTSEVTSILPIGEINSPFVLAGTGSNNTVSKVSDGFRFSAGQYFTITGLSNPNLTGIIIVAEVSFENLSGTAQVVNYSNNMAYLRRSITTTQAVSQVSGSSGTLTGSPEVNTKYILAIEVDGITGVMRTRNIITGDIISVVGTAGTLSPVSLNIGQGLTGTIHRVAVFNRHEGETFPISFEDLIDEFSGDIPDTPQPTVPSVVVNDGDGQSLELGFNAGALLAPDGRRWRDVFTTPDVKMLSGLVRADGPSVTHAAQPLLAGYNKTISASGTSDMAAMTNIPVGAMVAHGLVREKVIDTDNNQEAIYQYHGASGQSVLNFNNDTTDGSGTTVLYENQQHWLSEVVRHYSALGMPVTVPRRYWNQGEADSAMARGVYQTEFRKTHTQRINLIQSITGQTNPPKLYMFQTGGYANKTNDHNMVLDQLDCIKEWNGILVGPNWQVPVADRSVHPSQNQYLYLAELAVWATVETEAGRSWNLLPGTPSRVGNSITIPITVRNDEVLTTVSGKYTNYGGDPANLGLEAVGGGSITSATVSGGNILVEVSGTVTAIKHAHQRTGINYGNFVDSDGLAYVTHRSLIRTTLTKQVTVAGLTQTLERWVPSFEVSV